jgi:hypothetical protein
MSLFSRWGLPQYPYFTHGEYLNKEVLRNRNYPSFIIEGIKELSDKHFYWLNNKDPHQRFEYDTIALGLEVIGTPSEQLIMYISNTNIHLYHYKLDREREIYNGKVQLNKLHKEKNDVFKRMDSPNYIQDEESRNKVLDAVQISLDELQKKCNAFNSWEYTFEENWYRRLYDEPIPYFESDTLSTLINVAHILLELSYVEWGTNKISMIGINA